MDLRQHSCYFCGDPTNGEDSYVACVPCLLTLEREAAIDRRRRKDAARSRITPEVEARLRRLLNDW
jgi:hypothetical protein